MQTLTITVDRDEDVAEALREVLRLLEQGFTSGNSPQWELKKMD